MQRLKIAVVGAGISGLVAAYFLAKKNHEVTLFEKNKYLGGHTKTYIVQNGVDKGTPLDTGFIVLNDKTYPQFHKVLAEWGVTTRYSDMSFGYWDRQTNFRYAYTSWDGIFSQRRNIFDFNFWKLSYELNHFFKQGELFLRERKYHVTFGEFVKDEGFSKALLEKYILPMSEALWSVPASKILDFPAVSVLHFFENHGLLNFVDRPHWQTIVGGSYQYVEAFKKNFTGDFFLNSQIESIARKENSVEIKLRGGSISHFDKVVIATHADQALKLLDDPTLEETSLLSLWNYEHNYVVLHTDRSIMPKHKRAWASWNFHRVPDERKCLVTYHLNRLEGLNTYHDYFVTLNSYEITKHKILAEMYYSHPVFSLPALEGQKYLTELNGKNNTYFCGSYFGNGFHEGAVESALKIVEAL